MYWGALGEQPSRRTEEEKEVFVHVCVTSGMEVGDSSNQTWLEWLERRRVRDHARVSGCRPPPPLQPFNPCGTMSGICTWLVGKNAR
eukprot:1155215-Pelagomonas_calceolata.AAC.5